MKTAICTLYENDYHFGLGTLINSLFSAGYIGNIWIGYRGGLPPWLQNYQNDNEMVIKNLDNRIKLIFIKLSTEKHFTNYKPEFMISIFKEMSLEIDSLFYFDPDIIVKANWFFFEKWIKYGVTLCEDINSPIYITHPLREQWKDYFINHNYKIEFKNGIYFNAGFIGLNRDNINFLNIWQNILSLIQIELGGLTQFNYNNRLNIFYQPDQDALNITCGILKENLSIVGKEGMDFIEGGYIMNHAIGSIKPWNKNKFRSLLFKGIKPNKSDRLFLKNSQYPIKLYSNLRYSLKKINLGISIFLSRFWKG